MTKLSVVLPFYRDSIIKSYGQLFFSDSRGFGLLLMLVSFVDPYMGAVGLLSVIGTVAMANALGLNPALTRSGLYSYNTLMVGLVMGLSFEMSWPFLVVLSLGMFITLLITVWLAARTAIHKIPFLSLPFILGVWIMILSSRSLGAIHLSERGVYEINELWKLGGPFLVDIYQGVNAWQAPFALDIYLKSLSAIIFQPSVLSGCIIATGLVIYSRIAFSLSLVGFYSGYLFCTFAQGNLSDLQNSYVGFNFILTAIGLGGFFIVPSFRSYLLVALSAPVVSLLIGALNTLVLAYQLPLFSLPFSLLVIAMIFLLYNRYEAKGLALVALQEFSPEKNLYSYWNQLERFRNNTYYHIHLPFFGEWNISQGHEGVITHKGDYRFAWDFDVVDETGKTYRLPGKKTTDFYCYGLPVLAPAPGYVTTLIDEVEDNEIGDVNIDQNWGNTLVIKHGEYLYSKLSHIKQGSFKVKVGDYVTTGDTLAFCGNSGRSPEPHLHFQLQAAPHVGAKTLSYPICYYISKESDGFTFHSFEIPIEKQIVIRPITTKLLTQAFHFIPGMKLKFNARNKGQVVMHEWEVFVDAFNQPYLYCATTQSTAYFVNNGTLHYFTRFYGDRTSLLFLFYLGAYKVLLGYYPSLEINDTFPVEGFYSGIVKYAQDFIAPFKRYLKAAYSSSYLDANDLQDPTQLVLKASACVTIGQRLKRQIDFSFQMEREQITGFTVTENNVCIEVKRLA